MSWLVNSLRGLWLSFYNIGMRTVEQRRVEALAEARRDQYLAALTLHDAKNRARYIDERIELLEDLQILAE